jgi:hypothetical protein
LKYWYLTSTQVNHDLGHNYRPAMATGLTEPTRHSRGGEADIESDAAAQSPATAVDNFSVGEGEP